MFLSRRSHSTAGKSLNIVASQVISSPVSGSSQVIVCFSLPSAGGRWLTLRLPAAEELLGGLPAIREGDGACARQAVVR